MLKIMLDTCVWQNFALIQIKKLDKGRQLPDHLKKSKEVWETLKNRVKAGEIEVLATDWNLLEFRDQMTKLVLERKFIENGYSLTEFRTAKEQIELEKADFDFIDDLVFIIPALCGEERSNVNIDFDFLWKLCNSGISAFDAIHVQQANDNQCDYFVTRDRDLIAKIKKHKIKTKHIHLNQFLSKTKANKWH